MRVPIVLRRLGRTLRRRYVDARIRRGRSEVRLEPMPTRRAPGEAADPHTFDAARAWALLEAQCAMGARAPGTEGHALALEWIAQHLADTCDEAALLRWTQRVARDPGRGRSFEMCNVLGRIHGTGDGGAPPLMLSAHWDTRPVADSDPDPARRGLPVPGANDGASGVAVLLELARVLRLRRPRRPVILAFWDGEDLGEYYYGSRLFADLARRPAFRRWQAAESVVADMVAGRDLRCSTEAYSQRQHPALWARIQRIANGLGLADRFGGRAYAIHDDHVFLTRGGIPSVLLIDYTYPHWHTTHDVPEHCEAESLGVVGRVLEALARDTDGGGAS
jgi:glutaminyl-peptide cyclotransferase